LADFSKTRLKNLPFFRRFFLIYFVKILKNRSGIFFFPTESQRLSVAAVGDCGLFICRNTQKFERGRMLDLPMKPLLLLHFVSYRISSLLVFVNLYVK
jgi:hypothetical protein